MPDSSASRSFSTVLVYIIFAFTGVALVIPGTLLPVLLTKFHLRDSQGGLFLFVYFVGTAIGALFARGKLPNSIARGAFLTALGACCLPFAVHTFFLLIAIAFFGIGLGIAMTSVSVLQARNYYADRSAELTRLNLLWSLGATAGPWLGLHGAQDFGVNKTLLCLSACSALAAILAMFSREFDDSTPALDREQLDPKRAGILLLLSIPLATGIEAASGGWLTTYAARFHETLSFTVAAGTCFWAGILSSRLTQTIRSVAHKSARMLLIVGPALMISGLLLLVFCGGGLVSAGAFLLGLGVGPMYPLLLAYSLRGGERSNIAFLIAGCGSSLLPMLTGEVSGVFGGLRYGLSVPLVAAGLMLVSDVVIRRDLSKV